MEYKIIYSKRKTIAIYVRKDMSVEVRCPKNTKEKIIEDFVIRKQKWIEKAREKIRSYNFDEFEDENKEIFVKKCKEIIPTKVEFFSKLMNVTPSSIRIGNAKSYWGCCSGDNRINFSWRVAKLPEDIIDYIVVHELAHIKQHNHSKLFWKEIEKVLPNYKETLKELKKFN